MKKIFIAAAIVCGLVGAGFGQENVRQDRQKISRMIADSEKTNAMLAGMMGIESGAAGNSETTILSAVTFPNAVEVKFLGETKKIEKNRKKAADKWLSEHAKTPAARKFYVSEMLVEQDGARYWIMAHEVAVIGKIKNRAGETLILKMRVLGFTRKGANTDYYLLADGLQ